MFLLLLDLPMNRRVRSGLGGRLHRVGVGLEVVVVRSRRWVRRVQGTGMVTVRRERRVEKRRVSKREGH